MVSTEILKRYPFFGRLSAEQLKDMAMIAEEQNFVKGAVICEEGQPSTALYFLVEGSISLYNKLEDEFRKTTRKDLFVGELNPGEVFAISVLVEPNIYTATVKAEKSCRVIRFDSAGLKDLIEKDPQLDSVIMRKIATAAMERLAFARIQLAAAWAK